MDRFLIVANWKANQPQVSGFRFQVSDKIEIVIAAPFTMIEKVPLEMRAAQDISAYPVGAYTGEVPGKLLADLGVKYCLVGHSERRKYLHETNKEVEAKMTQAMENGIMPILCAQSLEEIPENIRNFPPDKYMVMYEPSSAISTAGQYHPEDAQKVMVTLTGWKNKLHLQCRFLYGGSVNASDVANYLQPGTLVSGLVVGHASLEVESFFDIISQCLKNLQ